MSLNMKKDIKKPRIGIVGLTSCEGCQFSVMDLGQKFFELLKEIEIVQFRLLEEKVFKTPKMDICFVEGSVVTKHNAKILKELRENSKILVALGNCSSMGGIHQIKNYHQPLDLIKETYFNSKVIDNPDVLDIDKIVKIDYVLPGCPVNNLEFLKLVYSLLRKIDFRIPQKPICFECQSRGYRCVLLDGEPCLGPMILGGCEAICLKSQMPCQGCRGLFKNAQVGNHLKHLKSLGYKEDEINHFLEIYGLRNNVEELYDREN
jgi:sulfhydrogenase subunit delta